MIRNVTTAIPATALGRLRVQSPGAADLAVLASVAARVDRMVLRALRVELLEADATAEADLWFSDLVARRSANEIVLRTDLLPQLRAELANSTKRSRARALVQAAHDGGSPLLVLEEELLWLALTGETAAEIERKLGSAVTALRQHADRAQDIAGWALTALPRLPHVVRGTAAAWSLAFEAERQSGYAIALDGDPPPGAVVVGPDFPKVALGVARAGDDLLIGAIEGATVPVPATSPRVITVELDARPTAVSVADGQVRRVAAGQAKEIVLGNLLGERWRVETAAIVFSEPDLAGMENGRWILVHGTEGFEIPPHHAEFSRALGGALAVSGFSLVTFGRTGVSHVVARAFVTGLEARGFSSCIYRLLHIVPDGDQADLRGYGRVLPPGNGSPVAGALARATAALMIGGSKLEAELAADAIRSGIPYASVLTPNEDSWLTVPPPDAWTGATTDRFVTEVMRALRSRLTVDADPVLQVPEELLHQAAVALDQRDLDHYNEKLHPIEDLAPKMVPPAIAEQLLSDPRQSHRLVGHCAVGNSPGLEALVRALVAERRAVQTLWETRTLWFALNALPRDWKSIPSVQCELAAAISSIETELSDNDRIDPSGACRDLLARSVPTNEWTTRAAKLASRASSYATMRRTLAAGPKRTSQMTALVDEVEQRFGLENAAGEAAVWFVGGREGQRIVALGLLLADPDPVRYGIVESSIELSLSAFEQYTSLRVAERMLDRLNREDRERLASRLNTQRSRPNGQISDADQSRWTLSGRLLDRLKKMGVVGPITI